MGRIWHRWSEFGEDYLQAAWFRVKFRDVFSMKYLYILMHEWLVEEDYAPRKNANFPEDLFWKKEKPRGNEFWFYWRCKKEEIGLIKFFPSKFWRYEVDINTHILDLKDTEVVRNGLKFKVNSGEVEVKLRAFIVADWEKAWRKHPLLKHFLKIMWKRMVYKNFLKHKARLYSEMYRFQEAIKTYLRLETYLPEPELQEFFKTRKEY